MDLLRQYVGGPKNRYKDEKYNLDLTYITPRLIAMAFPASGIQKLYRNPIQSVKEFLVQHHGSGYLIINLSGRQVDESVLQNVLTFDWQDHQAPPLQMLFDVCQKMSDFLQASYNNVVAVNCNHGKGRTGTIICCFLLYCNMFKTSQITMDFYAKKRFEKEQGYGVTQPCQVLYIKYFQNILKNPSLRPRIISIARITFRGQTKHQLLYIKAKTFSGRNIFTTKTKTAFHKNKNQNQQDQLTLIPMQEVYFCGDCKFYIKAPGTIGSNSIASYSFNTAFLVGNTQKVLFEELSPYSLRKTDNFASNFTILFQFRDMCKCPPQAQFNQKCQKCKQNLAEQQLKWKKIGQTLGKRRQIQQRQRQSMLGFHLKNNKPQMKSQYMVQDKQMLNFEISVINKKE